MKNKNTLKVTWPFITKCPRKTFLMRIKLHFYEKLNGLFLKYRLTFIHEFNSMEIIFEMISFSMYENVLIWLICRWHNHYSCGVWKIFVEIKNLSFFAFSFTSHSHQPCSLGLEMEICWTQIDEKQRRECWGVKQEYNESYSMFKKISDILQLGFSKSQQILFAAALFLWPSVASCNAWLAFKCPRLQNVFVTTKKIFFSALHSPQTERSILVFVESEMEKFVERICCFGLYYCHI